MPETCWDNINNKSPFVASSWSHTYLHNHPTLNNSFL